jgi:hypothetical protein
MVLLYYAAAGVGKFYIVEVNIYITAIAYINIGITIFGGFEI